MNQDLIDYFMRETDKKMDAISKDIKEIKKDVEKLVAFRLMLMGLSGLTAGVVTIILEVIFK